MANKIVAGELYESITGQLFEIGRQLRQPNGYPFDYEALKHHLQNAIEGRFNLTDFFRETGELTIEIPALPRPTLEELREKFPWIKKIERDTSPTGPVTLKFGTVLRPGEDQIDSVEYEQRIAPKLDVLLGFQHAEWLREHQQEFPALMALLEKVYIDFFGLVVVDEDGRRYYPYLDQVGQRFDQFWLWLSDDFSQNGRVAFSGK